MESTRSGPYLFRLGLYADADLSPANLGEAFDYYSAVQGWGWRAVVYAPEGHWQAGSVAFGAARGDTDYALPEPEGEMESYFPCGRVVALADGGVAFEGGIAIPPRELPCLGDEVAVWAQVRDEDGRFGAEARFRLVENESWDGLCPADLLAGAYRAGRQCRVWSPVDEPTHAFRAALPPTVEPSPPGLPTTVGERVERAIELARDEARRLRRDRPGSEDLLLGLAREGTSQAARALQEAGIGLREARAAVEFLHTAALGTTPVAGTGLLPSAEKALRLAADEARRERHDRVESRHLLLGLLRQNGAAAEAIAWLGVSPATMRAQLLDAGSSPGA